MNLIFLYLVFLFDHTCHDYHISRVDINADTKSQNLQLTYHFFIDDLESAINEEGVKGLRIGTMKENENTDEYISDYILSKSKIYVNNKLLVPDYLGKEVDEDLQGIFFYMEADLDLSLSKIKIELESTLLISEFADQKNIVTFLQDNVQKKQDLLDKNNKKCSFIISN